MLEDAEFGVGAVTKKLAEDQRLDEGLRHEQEGRIVEVVEL